MLDIVETKKSILLINQNSQAANLISNLLGADYDCKRADSVETAFLELSRKEYPVILCDADLPDIDGLEVIRRARTISRGAAVILLSEERGSDEAAIKAFRAGAFDFLRMPAEFENIAATARRAFEQYESKISKDEYQLRLENLVARRTAEIDKALEEVENSYRITLKALVQALETRDFETRGHSERAVTFSLRLGHELGLEKEALRDLELGALLHDIGKIGVPDAILRKPAALNEEEWKKMKLHPLHGQQILRNIKFLEGAARVVCQHHEKWDGSGYPFGLRGEDIDTGARIFAVADAFDAMISDRVYRRGRSFEAAVEELERCAGAQFDPIIVEAFKRIPKDDWDVLRERSLKDKQELLSFQAVVAELIYSCQQFELIH